VPTISVTIPQMEMKRLIDACKSQTGLTPKEAVVRYLKSLVVTDEYSLKEKQLVEEIKEARRKIVIPVEIDIS
jgi:hypothetical protein